MNTHALYPKALAYANKHAYTDIGSDLKSGSVCVRMPGSKPGK